ncbi:MAG: polyphosphate polymerase domain-containing protein [Lachnospiraceae bacterium]|jgi:hypothetical protein|nr:polyphosphate polymerase domain-containing protein [Lachnospiraceae bacterium]
MEKSRREIKFLLSHAEYLVIKSRIAALLACDAHAGAEGYFVRSVYFDDLRDTAYKEKVNGVFNRRKYRLRTYNDNLTYINLECKEKYNKWVEKRAARLDAVVCEALLQGEFGVIGDIDDDVVREFYVTARETGLRPAATVDYRREAFVYPASRFRITFDKHLRAGNITGFSLARAEGEVSLPVFAHDNVIMEIKYDEFMPQAVRSVIPHETGKALAVSKYCLCREIGAKM